MVRRLAYLHFMTEQQTEGLRAVQSAGRWRLDGSEDLRAVIDQLRAYADDAKKS